MALPQNQNDMDDAAAVARLKVELAQKERDRVEAERVKRDTDEKTRKIDFNKRTIAQHESDLAHLDIVLQQALKTVNDSEEKKKRHETEAKRLRTENDQLNKDIENLRAKLK